MTPGEAVVVDVRAAGVAFPEVLQTRGEYQFKPELPFVPGAEVAGVVRSAPAGAPVAAGDRVAGLTFLGGFAEVALTPAFATFKLPDALDWAQGASLVFNYHTAYFCLHTRGRLAAGERVLVHGAAGGVGTAAIQVAKGLGATTVAVVSSDEKERVAREAGADDVVRADGPWKDEVKASGGVDVVIDPVGGDRSSRTRCARCARAAGSSSSASRAARSPRSRSTGSCSTTSRSSGPAGCVRHEQTGVLRRGRRGWLDALIAAGHVRPVVGARLPLEQGAEALKLIDERRAVGKVVLDVAA